MMDSIKKLRKFVNEGIGQFAIFRNSLEVSGRDLSTYSHQNLFCFFHSRFWI